MKKILFVLLLTAFLLSCTKEAPKPGRYNNENGKDTTHTTPTPERRF